MRTAAAFSLLVLALLAVCGGALLIGAADTTVEIVTALRAPRIALAVVVGIGLGAAGAVLQGTFRNPLADPGIVGVSAGAAIGSAALIALGAAFGGPLAAAGAVIGGLLAMWLVTRVAREHGRSELVTLVLAGVAVTALAAALISITVAATGTSRSVSFWTQGSLSLASWPAVALTLPLVAVGIALAITVARPLDVLSLGDRAAATAGIPVRRTRSLALAGAVLLVAGGVAVVGVVAFIGLVVPHAVRLLIGPSHRALIAGSALAGAVLLVVADTVARTLVAPVELPVGVVTAVIGAPLFLLLIIRARNAQGGWA